MDLSKYLGKIRPQITLAILGLLVLGLYGLRLGHIEITSLAGAGIIALAKDVLASDND
jgi:hypothetical protein